LKRFTVVKNDLFRGRVNLRNFPFAQYLNTVRFKEIVRAQGHPFRLGISGKVIFAQIRTIVRHPVFARDDRNSTHKTFFSKRL